MSAQTFSLPLSAHDLSAILGHVSLSQRKNERGVMLWYGGVGVGLLAGVALSTFLWRRRLQAVEAAVSPLERAEELIANCERKLETIEQSVADLKDLKSDLQVGSAGSPNPSRNAHAESN